MHRVHIFDYLALLSLVIIHLAILLGTSFFMILEMHSRICMNMQIFNRSTRHESILSKAE